MSETDTNIDISKLSEREKRILLAIAKGLNGQNSVQEVAHHLHYRPARTGTLSCSKTLRSLEARGIVGRTPPRDQWSCAYWFLQPIGTKLVQDIKQEPDNHG